MGEHTRQFVAGGIGGMAGVIVGYPMDTVKVRQQCSTVPMSLKHCMTDIYKQFGFRGFYRGLTTPMTFSTPVTAMAFTGNSLAKRNLTDSTGWNAFIAGSCGGLAASNVSCPSERIKCIMQERSDIKKPSNAFKYILKTEGLRGFYKGIHFTMARDTLSYGSYFLGLYYFRPIFNSFNDFGRDLMAGGFAGILFWIAALPADRLKSIYQTDIENKFKSGSQVVQHIIKNDGFLGFYKGFTPTIIRAFPSNSICFLFYSLAYDFL